ncbi:hypothetical protein Scep_012868 [Stephania cephalantha]|uniref:Uncharacterized protein n=1 Tax=Stephania cephalantha TaxID=152367 RepID=A0AAP0JGR8_9MAGN
MGNWGHHSWYQSRSFKYSTLEIKTQNQRKLGMVELRVEPYDPDRSLRWEVRRVGEIKI